MEFLIRFLFKLLRVEGEWGGGSYIGTGRRFSDVQYTHEGKIGN
jgi:hypothetical protein